MTAMIDPKASLFDNIRRMRGLWFGVVDGAQVDDVVANLSQTPLQGRPLYIGLENKPEQLKTAPFLAALNKEDATTESLPDENLIKHCFDVAKTSSACVFWHCNAGGDILYHHLRSLNKIIVPQEQDGIISATATETVLFRHADANVMAQIMPALNMAELSRLLGSAELILARPSNEWNHGLLYTTRSPNMSEPHHSGFLQLSPQSYQKITLNRHQGIINKIEIFLNKVTAHSKPHTQEIKRIARESFVEAYKNGIRTQPGFYSWAYFYYEFGEPFGNEPELREYLASGKGKSKDELLKTAQYRTVARLKNMGV